MPSSFAYPLFKSDDDGLRVLDIDELAPVKSPSWSSVVEGVSITWIRWDGSKLLLGVNASKACNKPCCCAASLVNDSAKKPVKLSNGCDKPSHTSALTAARLVDFCAVTK